MALELSFFLYSFLLGYLYPLFITAQTESKINYKNSILFLLTGFVGFFVNVYFGLQGVNSLVVVYVSLHVFFMMGIGSFMMAKKGTLGLSLTYFVFFFLLYYATNGVYSFFWDVWILFYLFSGLMLFHDYMVRRTMKKEDLQLKGFLALVGLIFSVVKFFYILMDLMGVVKTLK